MGASMRNLERDKESYSTAQPCPPKQNLPKEEETKGIDHAEPHALPPSPSLPPCRIIRALDCMQ